MYKNIFLLSTILIFSSCAERGYTLKSHLQSQTAIAESIVNIDIPSKNVPKKLIRLSTVVKKELNKLQTTSTLSESKYLDEQLLSSSTEDLVFSRISKDYHSFGNSEIHGHVIYMNTSGQESTLDNTNIYILPTNSVLDNWYENYYLSNNRENNYGTKVSYLNSTYLNLSKNFAFHGVSPGDYYVIIVADAPNDINHNKKIYIAKKIHVENRKKIMAVFSKKL